MGRKYRNPPVVEALAEVFFAESAWTMTVPGQFFDRVRERLPIQGQRADVRVELRGGRGKSSAQTTHGEPRAEFWSTDRSRLIQVGRDLLVVNQLPPYPGFDDWSPRVGEAVTLYRELARPSAVERVTLRYLNRLLLPPGDVPMERYFRVYPAVPPEVSGVHGRFAMRLELQPSHADHSLVFSFATAPSDGTNTDHSVFLLDLHDTRPLGGDDSFGRLARALEEAHENIEHAFEGMITDATRELFDRG